jgi:hypothetical protein
LSQYLEFSSYCIVLNWSHGPCERFIIVILFSSKYCIFCVNLILELLVFVVNPFFCSEHYHFTSHKVQDVWQLFYQLVDEDVHADMLMWALDRGSGGSSRLMTATASPPVILRRGCSTWSRNAAISSQLKKRLASLPHHAAGRRELWDKYCWQTE